MQYLILSVVASASIGILLSLFHRDKSAKMLYIFLGNYIVASLFSLFSNDVSLNLIGSKELLFGGINGFLFFTTFIIYEKNIKKNGLSLSVGVMRVSLLIPIVLSIFIYHDFISKINTTGIAAVIAGFYLMSNTKTYRNLFWLLILFIFTGVQDSILKIYNEIGLHQSLFIFMIFTSALFFNSAWIVKVKEKVHFKSILYGFLLGIPNQLTTKFFVKSLDSINAAIAYPVKAAGVVVTCLLFDIIVFRKKFSAKERISLLFLIIGIILINIR